MQWGGTAPLVLIPESNDILIITSELNCRLFQNYKWRKKTLVLLNQQSGCGLHDQVWFQLIDGVKNYSLGQYIQTSFGRHPFSYRMSITDSNKSDKETTNRNIKQPQPIDW
jgi:hypothetical protein